MGLAQEKCEVCHVPQSPLSREEAQELLKQIKDWTLRENSIEREFKFNDFNEAMDFANDVAALAREADHHPDILISYNRVRLELTTHKIKGLSRNDFVLAARIDQLVI